ncbi:MAG TPA: DUF58 domain-containing protein [Abditibacteriaceae bacterium]|jgi:uncharacterized protein (DUF58 family)
MLPSLRLGIYFAFGSLLWVAAAVIREFVVVATLYLIILIFVAGMDLLLSPRPSDFEISRRTGDKMNLGVPNKVFLLARNKTGVAVELTMRDEPPAAWPVKTGETSTEKINVDGEQVPPVARVVLPTLPRVEAETSYNVTPTRRGVWKFGALSARYASRLGLWYRQFRREAKETVHVYPDTGEVRRYELHLRQGRMRDIGLHVARLRGRGTDFESLREYSSDDNYKDINWKASARRGKLVSTNYEVERDQSIIIALDCGRMMTAMATTKNAPAREAEDENGAPVLTQTQTTPLSKLDCAINATVLLAHVSASMGDAVGLLLFADTVLGFVPPRKGKTQTGVIIEALYAVQPSLVEPDYAGAYNYLLARKIRRSLVVTFTDLIDPDASRELLASSGALRKRHNPLCVTINNRDVMDLAAQMPETADELYSKAMAQRMLSQREQALRDLQQRGVGILDVEASELTIATVNRYLDLKARAAL